MSVLVTLLFNVNEYLIKGEHGKNKSIVFFYVFSTLAVTAKLVGLVALILLNIFPYYLGFLLMLREAMLVSVCSVASIGV